MNLKLKFALLFSLLVFIILICSASLIYYLYSDSRKTDFNKRLWAVAVQNYQAYYHLDQLDIKTLREIDRFPPGNFVQLQTVLIDRNYRVVFTDPDTLHYTIDYNFLNKVRTSKEYYFSEGSRGCVALYFDHPAHECFVITSADDGYGRRRMAHLQLIITLVVLGGILLTGVSAFIYVQQLTKPLVKLGAQMQQITENNLRERVQVQKGNNELAQIAANFNDMLNRLEKGFEFQKSFVHHASHELRTPLASMLSQTEAALRRNLDAAEAREVLQSLKEDQQEMIELTNSLLLLSQYEQVSYSLDWPKVRLDEILYDTIDMTKRLFPGINISLEFVHVPENELFLSIRGNEALLRSAFRNLIRNAFQYSDDKNVAILIDADQEQIRLHFKNKGNTLNQAEQERLFIPFFRGENAARKRGFGLGLSIVKRIISLHKGAVQYNITGPGENCFTVSFQMPV